MTPAARLVEHVTCTDDGETVEYWTCGDVVLQDGPLDYTLSVRGVHRIYLNRTTLAQLRDIIIAREDPAEAVCGGWLVEHEVAS